LVLTPQGSPAKLSDAREASDNSTVSPAGLMSTLRLISTDFDGTIHSDTEVPGIPLSLQRRLVDLQAAGVRWVINTGRDRASLAATLAEVSMAARPDFLVLVEREVYVREERGFVPLGGWNRRCDEDHQQVFERVRVDLDGLTAWIRSRFDATVYSDPWSPLCLMARTNRDADAVMVRLEEYCAGVPDLAVMRNDVYARFCHRAYHKGSALAEIGRHLGVGPAEILAAGDQLNDLPMLVPEVARWLVAPANAIEPVKAAVRRAGGHVSGRPAGHGVEEALDRLTPSLRQTPRIPV